MEGDIQVISLAVLLLVFIINAVVRRREDTPQRPIAAFDVLPAMTARSVEAGEPIHASIGSATIGDESTLTALLGKEFIYYLTREVAIGDTSPIITVADTAALPLALDTLRRAYTDEDRMMLYNPLNVRWYPSSSRRLAYAAAIMAMHADDRVSGNVLMGRFGSEIGLILAMSNRKKRLSLAVSDELTGQAVAYAMASAALIGEELFAAPAYADDNPAFTQRNTVIDLLRWLLMAAIVGILIVNLVNGA